MKVDKMDQILKLQESVCGDYKKCFRQYIPAPFPLIVYGEKNVSGYVLAIQFGKNCLAV